MNSETIIYCIFAVILGMLVFHMLKNICGCKVVEGACEVETLCSQGDTYSSVGNDCCLRTNEGLVPGTCQIRDGDPYSNNKYELICQRNPNSSSVQNTDQGH